ncbi:MAG: signal transduction histidine kinase [Candidatus Krumholzibacteriia bacterium]|jgi:signal transduction histidine kinase
MNVANKKPHSPARNLSTSKWLHSIIALAAIALYIIGGAAQSKVSGLPREFDLDKVIYPAHIGQFKVNSEAELIARVAGQPIGSSLVLSSYGTSTTTVLRVQKRFSTFHDLVNRINGLVFLAVSLVVFAPRIKKNPARGLYWACLLYGLAVMVGGIYQPQNGMWPGVLLPLLRILIIVILPLLLLSVGLSFPQRKNTLQLPWLVPGVLLVGLIIAGSYSVVWLRWAMDLGEWHALELPRRFSGVYLALVFGSGLGFMVHGYRNSILEPERVQVKWLLWGIAMGSFPFVFLYALPVAFVGISIIPIELARLFSIVIPIAMSFVVIKHKFLDVDIIIRRSLLYVLLAAMMVGIYGVIGILIGNRVQEQWPAIGPYVPIVATVVASMLFAPTRRGFAQLIDRVFFKIRYVHAKALADFRSDLRSAENQQEVADRLSEFLANHFRPHAKLVILNHQDQRFEAGKENRGHAAHHSMPDGVSVMALTGTTDQSVIETGGFPAIWRSENYVLSQAIETDNVRFGYLTVSEKSTGRSYVSEDLKLIAAAASETAICMRRMNLEHDFIDEVVARNRMEERNKFRSDFFAQFAHDLRSPLTSINWGARNMLDGVVGEINESQRLYLEGIDSSARQLVRLVNNILEATRLESELPVVEFTAVDLVKTLNESVTKLRLTAEANKVTLLIDHEDRAIVYGNEEKLLEVIDNLVENAIRYAPPQSEVTVSISVKAGVVVLVVTDHGPGIAEEDLDAIFESYRQGAKSPHSSQQGFGLGLFVVKSWVERMGGKVQAKRAPSGGAMFVVTLPEPETNSQEEPA